MSWVDWPRHQRPTRTQLSIAAPGSIYSFLRPNSSVKAPPAHELRGNAGGNTPLIARLSLLPLSRFRRQSGHQIPFTIEKEILPLLRKQKGKFQEVKGKTKKELGEMNDPTLEGKDENKVGRVQKENCPGRRTFSKNDNAGCSNP